jgi:hypothetical protein
MAFFYHSLYYGVYGFCHHWFFLRPVFDSMLQKEFPTAHQNLNTALPTVADRLKYNREDSMQLRGSSNLHPELCQTLKDLQLWRRRRGTRAGSRHRYSAVSDGMSGFPVHNLEDGLGLHRHRRGNGASEHHLLNVQTVGNPSVSVGGFVGKIPVIKDCHQ